MKKRGSWSDDEKREICQQTMLPVVSVAQVARRYSMNANMIYTWLKDPRFAPLAGEAEECPSGEGALERDLQIRSRRELNVRCLSHSG